MLLRKLIIYIILFVSISVGSAHAQEFTKAYGTNSPSNYRYTTYSEKQNCYFVLGQSGIGSAITGIITKMDLNGNILWTRKLSSALLMEKINVVDDSITGIPYLIVSGSTLSGGYNLTVYKINAITGNIVWGKRYSNLIYPHSIVYKEYIYLLGTEGNGMSLSRIDFNGNILWTKKYVINSRVAFVGYPAVHPNGSIAIPYQSNGWGVLCIDTKGDVKFNKKIDLARRVRNINVTPEGFICSFVYDWDDRTNHHGFFKFDTLGNLQLKKHIYSNSAISNAAESEFSVLQTSTNKIIYVTSSGMSGRDAFNYIYMDINGKLIQAYDALQDSLNIIYLTTLPKGYVCLMGSSKKKDLCTNSTQNSVLSVFKDDGNFCVLNPVSSIIVADDPMKFQNQQTEILSSDISIIELNDQISLIDMAQFPFCDGDNKKVNLGPNITTCTSTTIDLNAGTGYKTYQWSTGASTPIIQVNTSGTYWVRVVDNCDVVSRDTISVSISSNKTRNQTISICQGKSYTIGSHIYTTAGSYKDTLTTVFGCDSIVNTTLRVLPTSTIQQSFAICAGESVQVGSHTYTQPGSYQDILTKVNGCDSIINTTITFKACGTTIGGIVNKYTPVTRLACNKIYVEDGSLFESGNRVIVIQMQGAVVDTSNTENFGSILDYGDAGNYEFNTIKSTNGNEIELEYSLKNNYSISGRVQMVYVPVYSDVVISSELKGKKWDGKSGGIIAIEASGNLSLSANINASGIGFRGGRLRNNSSVDNPCEPDVIYQTFSKNRGGQKGEGIAVWDSTKILNKGAWANGGGGGNYHNAGGGGGANGGAGGQGGKIYYDEGLPNCLGGNGLGGNELSNDDSKIFMGAGGGSGHGNDEVGSSGGAGGGIVLIKSKTMSGANYSIQTTGLNSADVQNDGAGGAGAGGTIVIESDQISNVNLISKGGKGGDNLWTHRQCVAPGGGGGGGVIRTSGTEINVNKNIQKGLQGILAGYTIGTLPAPCVSLEFEAQAGVDGKTYLNAKLLYSAELNSSVELDTLTIDTTICDGKAYSLPDGIEVTDAGVYNTILKNIDGCDSIFIITTLQYAPELTIDLGSDTMICSGERLQIGTDVTADTYLWNTGSTDAQIEVDAPGTYSLSVSNSCGTSSDSIKVGVLDCSCYVFIPNAFSPNGDGKNDVLLIKEENVSSSRLIIYNKWGEEVFSTDDNAQKWNGMKKDKQLPADVYGYYYEGNCVLGDKVVQKGNITIVR